MSPRFLVKISLVGLTDLAIHFNLEDVSIYIVKKLGVP